MSSVLAMTQLCSSLISVQESRQSQGKEGQCQADVKELLKSLAIVTMLQGHPECIVAGKSSLRLTHTYKREIRKSY